LITKQEQENVEYADTQNKTPTMRIWTMRNKETIKLFNERLGDVVSLYMELFDRLEGEELTQFVKTYDETIKRVNDVYQDTLDLAVERDIG